MSYQLKVMNHWYCIQYFPYKLMLLAIAKTLGQGSQCRVSRSAVVDPLTFGRVCEVVEEYGQAWVKQDPARIGRGMGQSCPGWRFIFFQEHIRENTLLWNMLPGCFFFVFSPSCSFKVRRNRAIDVLAEAQKVWYSENLWDQLLVSKAVGLVFPLLTWATPC